MSTVGQIRTLSTVLLFGKWLVIYDILLNFVGLTHCEKIFYQYCGAFVICGAIGLV